MVDEFAAQLREAAEKIGVQEDEYAFLMLTRICSDKRAGAQRPFDVQGPPQINGGLFRSLHAAGIQEMEKEVRAQMAEWWVDEPLELVYLVRMTFKGLSAKTWTTSWARFWTATT